MPQKQIEICPNCYGSGDDCDHCGGTGTVDVEVKFESSRTRLRSDDRLGDRR